MSNIQINPYVFGSDAISFDNVVNVQTAVSGTTLTASLTVSSNDNRMLIVSLTSYIDPADNPSGITFVVGGVTQNLQLFNDYGDTDGNGSIWYIANPTVGAGTITATWSSAFSKKGFSGYSFYNVASYGIANFTTAVGASNVANGSITPTTEGAAIFSSLSWVLGGSLNARPVSTLDYQYYIYTGGKTGGSSYNLTPTISASNAMNYTNIDDNGSTSESAPYRIGMIEMKPASYPFSPIDLPDVELWYDFSDISTVTKENTKLYKPTLNLLEIITPHFEKHKRLLEDIQEETKEVIEEIEKQANSQ